MYTFSKTERIAINVFMTDLYHDREIKKAFAHLCQAFSRDELRQLIEKLEINGTLTSEDREFLFTKVARFCS